MKNFQLNFVTNKTNVRWLKILDYLEKNSIATSQELSSYTGSSQRTVISELIDLKEYFHDIADIYSTKNGYYFSKINPTEFLARKRNIVESEPLFIVLEAIFHNKLYSTSDWADQFYLSEKTMITYLAKIKIELNKMNLDLSLTPVNITGAEVDIRYFFYLFYYESDITPHTVFPSDNVERTVIDFIELLNAKRIQPTSFSYFSYLTFISIERVKNGLLVDISPEIKKIISQSKFFDEIFLISKMIVKKNFDIELPVDEFIYIITNLLCKRNLDDVSDERLFVSTYNNWPEISMLTEEFHNEFLYLSPNKDNDIIFLESFFIAIKLKELISVNHVNNIEDINMYVKNKFPNEFHYYMNFLGKSPYFKVVFPLNFLQDISVRLVLHTESLKQSYWGRPKNIAFILEGNSYITQYIKSWTNSILGAFHNLYFPYEQQLNDDYIKLNDIDILVTNYADFLFEANCIEIVHFDSLPSADDWNRLLKVINPRILQNYNLKDRF